MGAAQVIRIRGVVAIAALLLALGLALTSGCSRQSTPIPDAHLRLQGMAGTYSVPEHPGSTAFSFDLFVRESTGSLTTWRVYKVVASQETSATLDGNSLNLRIDVANHRVDALMTEMLLVTGEPGAGGVVEARSITSVPYHGLRTDYMP